MGQGKAASDDPHSKVVKALLKKRKTRSNTPVFEYGTYHSTRAHAGRAATKTKVLLRHGYTIGGVAKVKSGPFARLGEIKKTCALLAL